MSQTSFPGGLHERDPDLTPRQRQIFAAIVRLHGETGQPIGSESIGRRRRLPWSAASIRSTLGELEEMGLLVRAHVSAGRIPTAAGYAFHVRRELVPAELPEEIVREVDERMRRASHDVRQLLVEASRLLAELTRQLGLAVVAPMGGEHLLDLDLTVLGPRRSWMSLRLANGAVHSLVLRLDDPLGQEELDEVAAVLRERLAGLDLDQVRARLEDDVELIARSAVRIVARAAAASWNHPAPATLFTAGAGELAAQPEFADHARLVSLLRLVEHGPPLDRLMVATAEGQSVVHVALDQDRALQGLSLVSFPLSSESPRAVGVLGPLRMNYARCVSVVELVGSRVAEYA